MPGDAPRGPLRRALEQGTVVLGHLAGHAPFPVQPFVEHSVVENGAFLLEADPVLCMTEHAWDAVITPHSLPAELGARGGDYTDLWFEAVARYRIKDCAETVTSERVLAARLESEEYPVALCDAAARGDWRGWLDAHHDDEIGLFDFVAHAAEDSGLAQPSLAAPLSSGSLHYLRMLAVHPLLRGQGLGPALLAHALWTLRRADGDLAILEALPAQSVFDIETPERTPATVRKLVKLYHAIGFRRVHPRRRITDNAEGMYFQFGAYPIRVNGGL